MAKYLTKAMLIKRVKNHLTEWFTDKETIVEILKDTGIKFNKSNPKDELVGLLKQQKGIDYFEVAEKYTHRAFGFSNVEIEELLGINKTIRQKMVKHSILVETYYKASTGHGKTIYMPFYSVMDVYNLTDTEIKKFVDANYKGGYEKLSKQLEISKLRTEIRELENDKNIAERFSKNTILYGAEDKIKVKTQLMQYEYEIKELLKKVECIKNGQEEN